MPQSPPNIGVSRGMSPPQGQPGTPQSPPSHSLTNKQASPDVLGGVAPGVDGGSGLKEGLGSSYPTGAR